MLVDIHAHLDHFRFKDDLNQVIENAKKANVSKIITAGVNHQTNQIALDLAKKYDIVEASLGLYPIDALRKEIEQENPELVKHIQPTNVDEEIEFIKSQKPIAVGEVGLDYNLVKDKKEQMKKVFQKIINMTEKINRPIIVHTRKAELDCIEMLESSSIKNIILHCFQGKFKLVRRCIDNGWNFSIPPVITRLEHFQKMAQEIDINQLLTETDAPYLGPFPNKRNEPAYITETIRKISEIKKIEPKEIENKIYSNFKKIFL